MAPRKFFVGRAVGISGTLVIVGIVWGFFALNNYIYREKQGGATYEPYRATLSGEFLCLPFIDTSVPQTDECAFGLRIDDGSYYVIDFNLMSQGMPGVAQGDRMTATGLVTPIERLSTDPWRK